MTIVYEYFLDQSGYITGWQVWPAKKKPMFSDNQTPLKEMLSAKKDDSGRIWNGGNVYKLLSGVIVKEAYSEEPIDKIKELEGKILAMQERIEDLEKG